MKLTSKIFLEIIEVVRGFMVLIRENHQSKISLMVTLRG